MSDSHDGGARVTRTAQELCAPSKPLLPRPTVAVHALGVDRMHFLQIPVCGTQRSALVGYHGPIRMKNAPFNCVNSNAWRTIRQKQHAENKEKAQYKHQQP